MSFLDDLKNHETVRQMQRFRKEKLPNWVIPAIIALAVISWIPLVFLARAQVSTSTEPRIQIFPDMDQQPKYKAQTANPQFSDGRAMRVPIDGTVAQGDLRLDDHLYRGKINDLWVTTFPIEIYAETMNRGQEQYGIFCSPCHGLGGAGDGMISLRAEELQEGSWIPPLSFHTPTVRGRTVGEIYNTIANGIRNMPGYGSQIPVEDRWAIVAYVRALQRSQNSAVEDVPENQRDQIR